MEESRPPAWESWIAPAALVDLVVNTAPFLFESPAPASTARLLEQGGGPRGFLSVLANWKAILDERLSPEEQLADYFALCVSCHHATVATFVPTDVDAKIRGLIWRKTRDAATLRAMADFALNGAAWSIDGISKRGVDVEGGRPVSGHDGEWLSILLGAHGRFVALGDAEYADKTAAAVDAELHREAEAFRTALYRKDAELDALRLATSITHNAGDVDQAIGFWDGRQGDSRTRFGKLAHENRNAYGGWFQVAAALYKDCLSGEGHRNYPLRGPKPLRRSADLLLPLGPFLDDWGATLSTHPSLSGEDRAEIVDALSKGCRKIPGQMGYYRALAGFTNASARTFYLVQTLLPNSARKELKDPDLRRLMAVSRVSFESGMRKRAAAARPRRSETGPR